MEKLSNIEKEQLEKLAMEYSTKISDKRNGAIAKLPKNQQNFLKTRAIDGDDNLNQKLYLGLKNGVYKKPSEFFEQECSWLFGDIIFDCHRESFMYEVDNCINYPYSTSWLRRPFRSEKYHMYFDRIHDIIYSYKRLDIPKSLSEILSGNLTEEEYAYVQRYSSFSEYDLAYQIDKGNQSIINWAKDTLESGNSDGISYNLLRGVFRGNNSELHELAGKLLLAARLQEGVRQAICETCDEGVYSAYLTILKVIKDNNLIRYSSVKRAVGTWTGLVPYESKDLDRIGNKSIDLIYDCLNDENYGKECLESDDAMKIFVALWSTACISVEKCTNKICETLDNSNHQQLLATAFFSSELGINYHKTAKNLILKHHDKLDIMAIAVKGLACDGFNINNFDADRILDDYFSSREEAEQIYSILYELYNNIPKKSIDFSPCVFSWNNESLTKSDIVKKLCLISAILKDNNKIDEMCVKLSEIDVSGYGTRSWELRLLLSEPKTETQIKAVVSACADRESYTRNSAFEIVKKLTLQSEHYRQFEDMLKYKNAEIRSNVISVLMQMKDDSLYECIELLLSDKKEEKRTAGLDIIMQLSKNCEKANLYEKCVPLTSVIAKPTSKEKILIEQIKPANKNLQEQVYGYGLYSEEDNYTPEWNEDYIAECTAKYMEYFPNSELSGNQSKDIEPDFTETLKKLDNLVEEHKNDEYTTSWGEKALLGSTNNMTTKLDDGTYSIAFAELWEDFYENEIKSTIILVRMNTFINISTNTFFKDMKKKIYGKEFLKEIPIGYIQKLKNILEHLSNKYAKDNDKLHYALKVYICNYPDTKDLFTIEDSRFRTEYHYAVDGEILKANGYIRMIPRYIETFGIHHKIDEKTSFAVNYKLSDKFGYFTLVKDKELYKRSRYSIETWDCPTVCSFIRACYYGVISEGYMYKHFFTEIYQRDEAIRVLSNITRGYRELESKVASRKHWGEYAGIQNLKGLLNIPAGKELVISDDDRKLIEFAVGIYEKLAKLILDDELRRGDSPSEFTDQIYGFQRIYGVERFVQILTAMGKDTFDRSSWHSSDIPSKKESFSHLLGVCVPDSDDTAEKLALLLKDTDVTEKRLVEAGLYSPQWIDIIQKYLNWNGFHSACYYFMAHMNESLDSVRTAIIAKYTPISTQDLMNGAFDIDWFKEAHETVGEKRFDIIYNSAKYISDGAKHSRARKYADAVMGKLDKSEAVKNIKEKRNKDTLMAYTLIPFESEDDIFERYLLLQEFKKESKKFGAQRKASEGKAVEIAMQNLAKNAGYEDVMRLTLRMETKLFDDIKELTEFHEVGDIALRLVISDDGKTSIECTKGGKALKSVPAKYKKDEFVVRLNDVKKQLTEQYRRTRIMLEQSMEDKVTFKASELNDLSSNLVVYPLIKNLVYINGKNIGFIKDMKLITVNGSKKSLKDDADIIIAHPVDLYNAGVWHEYQKYLFENQIIQPFKQVFRELYVKTEEESEAYSSRRYSGNQIQPRQTVGCLKSRRWVADIEDGLQKIYYKENIIARIYALADWFSPSEIEAPTLEWVDFSDRKTGKPIKISDIPDIIFSEVMRDVDLAVSVAHAGGVDPETSHSTIEMRRAICEFTMPLFKLTNVTFEKSHAFIKGERADYSIHLGSGVVHLQGGPMINILPVHSQHRGKLFLPFADEDPKTAQIISEILLFAEDKKIKDPFILQQIK